MAPGMCCAVATHKHCSSLAAFTWCPCIMSISACVGGCGVRAYQKEARSVAFTTWPVRPGLGPLGQRVAGRGGILRAVLKVCTAYQCVVPVTMSLVIHLYESLACLALISSAFVCVVVHVAQKGYPFWCYGDTFGSPFQLGIWTGPLCTSSHAPCATEEGEGREGLAKCAPCCTYRF